MLWGSDRYSNPVQMVLEGWLLSIISFWLACNCVFDWYHDYLGLASKKIKRRLRWSSAVGISNIEKVFLDCFWKLDYALLMHSDARVRWKSQRQSLPEFLILAWLGWYADSRFRHTAGHIFVVVKKTRASRDTLFVRVWLWSKCSGVVTDTLTLFSWF